MAEPGASPSPAHAPTVPPDGEHVLAGLELRPGAPAQSVADRLATLAARAAGAATAMIHMAEARHMRLVGGHALPEGFIRMESVPASVTLAGLVVHYGYALVIEDTRADARVPPDAPLHIAGVRAYIGSPVRDLDGQIVGVCAVMDYRPRRWQGTDLAAVDEAAQVATALVAQRRSRQVVERQRSFLDTLLDSLDTGVLACDAAGQLILVNRSLRTRLGIQPQAQPPERWLPTLPITHPDGRPFAAAEVPLLQALGGRQVQAVEHLARTAEGGRRLLSVNAHPINDPTGQRLGAVAVFHDITTRRRAERFRGCELEVTRALDQADTVAEAAPGVMHALCDTLDWPYGQLWLVEPASNGEALRCLERCRRPGFTAPVRVPVRLLPGQGLAGEAWQRGEPVWRTGPDVAAGADATTDGLRTALALPVASGGRILAVLCLFSDEPEDPRDDMIALLSGIAAHIGQFIERRRAESLQHALSASKDEYLNLVGHELRTPLAIIAAHIELIEDADPDMTLAEVRTMTAAIRRGSDRLRRLVEALLDLSALDSGHAHLACEPVDLTGVIRDAIAAAEPAAAAQRHTVTADLPDRLRILGDRGRLRQMVGALLDNAITYTPEGGRVTVRLHAEDDHCQLAVTDTGVGIPEAERPHVFHRFYRGEITTQRAIPGAGLGLPIAQLIAQRHHGEIALAPTPAGTTMVVRLPTPAAGAA